MKHIIGKRNGKTIVSGGGSLEEQKNNLKHWEGLDVESSPMKDRYNKRIKIDPQDVFLFSTISFGNYMLWYDQVVENKVVGELAEIPQPDLDTTTPHSKIEAKVGGITPGRVLEENMPIMYKPVQDANGNWVFKVPVANKTEFLEGFEYVNGKTNSVGFGIMIGCPLHYVETNDGGNITTKTIPNSSVEKCIKKYNIWQEFKQKYTQYVNYVKPENPTIVPFIYPLVYNAHYTALQLPVEIKKENIKVITGKVTTIIEDDGDAEFTADFNDVEIKSDNNRIVIGKDFIPYTTLGDNNILEFPKMYIEFVTLF